MTTQHPLIVQHSKVSVIAPARLHMGFIDLSGSLAVISEASGVALNEISTRLSVTGAEQLTITGPAAQRAEKCVAMLCQALNVSDKLNITIEAAIPEHVGLVLVRKCRWQSALRSMNFTV